MGTRSLTVVQDEQGKELVCMYRQMDGYPTGHGQELAEFLQGFRLVNGYGSDDTGAGVKAANGLGCLAAQIVAHFKEGIGRFYLYPPKSRDHGEEYIYTVYSIGNDVWLKVQAGDVTFFGLPGTKQKSMPVIFDGKVSEWNAKSAEETRDKLSGSIPNEFLEKASHNKAVRKR